MLGRGPFQRRTLTGPFLQRLPIDGNCLFELRRPALALPETRKRIAQISLGLDPVERHSLPGPFLYGLAIGSNRLFELRRPALTLPETGKRIAQIAPRDRRYPPPIGRAWRRG